MAMETKNKSIMELDLHQLDLRYDHTRFYTSAGQLRMQKSLKQYGQLTPVVVTGGHGKPFILVDGYKRVKALVLAGCDTVLAEVWDLKEEKALLAVLAANQARGWEALEQAAVIQELHRNFQYSLTAIAQGIGRDKSFVKRKLDLLESLPEEIIEVVVSGHLPVWTASRVLSPLARANADHARLLAQGLKADPLSNRELSSLFAHYKRANRKVREKIINQPHLFLKSLSVKQEEEEALVLSGGPEMAWLKDIKKVVAILSRLGEQVEKVFYSGQNQADRAILLKTLFKAEDLLRRMQIQIEGTGRS